MSTVVLNNNVYHTPEREREDDGTYWSCIFVKNARNTVDYLYPRRHGDILACIDGEICFVDRIADKVLVAVDAAGDYSPQSFGTAIAYGVNARFELRPCKWTPADIITVTFCQGPFRYNHNLRVADVPLSSATPSLLTALTEADFTARMDHVIASITGAPVKDTLYLAIANLTLVADGTFAPAAASAATPVESHPIPFAPRLSDFDSVFLQDTKPITSNRAVFADGRYDYVADGYFYVINSVITTTADESPLQLRTSGGSRSPEECTGYMVCGQVLFIPVSAI